MGSKYVLACLISRHLVLNNKQLEHECGQEEVGQDRVPESKMSYTVKLCQDIAYSSHFVMEYLLEMCIKNRSKIDLFRDMVSSRTYMYVHVACQFTF